MLAPKPVSASSVVMGRLMLPEDANPAGFIHGGVVLKLIDSTGGVVAMRHVRGNAVTASIDRVDFLKPVFVGELVQFKASLNLVGRTSMEVGVRVECENLFTGEVRHTMSAYLTFVALDEHGKPTPVPPVIFDSADAKRRSLAAIQRRDIRRAEKAMETKEQDVS